MGDNKFTIPMDMIKSSPSERLVVVADFVDALDLEGVTIHMDLHKAKKGETLKTPHLNPVIGDLENQFYDLWEPHSIVEEVLTGIGINTKPFSMQKAKKNALYKSDGHPLTDKELDRLRKIIADALHIDIAKVDEIILKSALVAKVASTELMGQKIKVDISKLPIILQDAIKELHLTATEVHAIKFAIQYAGANVTNVSSKALTSIQNMVVEAIQTRMAPRQLASKMFTELAINDSSVLNRDWERIAITEINRAANDGFIASQPVDSYVIGDSHDDACQYCLSLINLKIYRVTDDPPEEYGHLKPRSKKYKELAHRWDTEVWVGKSNIGRSLSPKKRVDGVLVPREHYELSTPTLHLHSGCRCRWSEWIPELFYIKDGRVEFAVDDVTKKEQQEWLKANPHIKIGK